MTHSEFGLCRFGLPAAKSRLHIFDHLWYKVWVHVVVQAQLELPPYRRIESIIVSSGINQLHTVFEGALIRRQEFPNGWYLGHIWEFSSIAVKSW